MRERERERIRENEREREKTRENEKERERENERERTRENKTQHFEICFTFRDNKQTVFAEIVRYLNNPFGI